MQCIKIHKFSKEIDVKNAIDSINVGEGIPAFKDSKTTSYCDYHTIEDFYYIISDTITEKYISHSEDLEINPE